MSLLVNLFAGPGAGKSTMAASVFSKLKTRGVCAEIASEFAKDLCWEKRFGAMSCQPYVFGEQLWRIQRLKEAGVEVIVTDSPLLLSTVYGDMPASFHEFVREMHRRNDNLNVFVRRVKTYDPRGRCQSESEARDVDQQVRGALQEDDLMSLHSVTGNEAGADYVVERVRERLA